MELEKSDIKSSKNNHNEVKLNTVSLMEFSKVEPMRQFTSKALNIHPRSKVMQFKF